MEALKHLELYDLRRFDKFSDIRCHECAHFSAKGCANAVAVLDAMRSRGNDMSIPVFDFRPDGDARADQCPGMWPGEDYLAETGQTMREHLPTEALALRPVDDRLVSDLGRALGMLDRMIAANGGEAA